MTALAATSGRNGSDRIFTMDPDGANVTEIAGSENWMSRAPSW